jgi:DNA replication protein DnaC
MLNPSTRTGVAIERQEKILAYVAENPLASYVFSGAPGVGKTTLLKEVERRARIARPRNFPVYSETMTKFQHDTTSAARGERIVGLVRANSILTDAKIGCKWGIFLDDFDKVSGSEFIRLHIFEVLNNVAETNSQLVLSTNLSKLEFTRFFGDHVAWRVFGHCKWVEMLREQTPANA